MLTLLKVVDEFTGESLAMYVVRGIDADQTVATVERIAAERHAPT